MAGNQRLGQYQSGRRLQTDTPPREHRCSSDHAMYGFVPSQHAKYLNLRP
jgi:hypothetical protein